MRKTCLLVAIALSAILAVGCAPKEEAAPAPDANAAAAPNASGDPGTASAGPKDDLSLNPNGKMPSAGSALGNK